MAAPLQAIPLMATVASISRFHSFELARQLENRQALAAIYTGLARRFVRRYGVRHDRLRSFPWIQTPLEIAQRFDVLSPALTRRLGRLAHCALDSHIARTLPACHVYMALAGIGLASGTAAQARNIAYVCDRSSAHIEFQNRLLADAYQALDLPWTPIATAAIERDLAEYEQADAVVVPSRFAYDSFIARGFPEHRLHRVPFGVNLTHFSRQAPRDEEFRVLFVGAPGVQKGLHFLLQAFARAAMAKSRLVIVGHPEPETAELLKRFPVAGIELVGPVPPDEVARQMSRASVLVMPSIQEGLAVVQAEALACACPVISSTHAGGADLFEDCEQGFIVPVGDIDALAERLTRLRDDPVLLAEMSAKALLRAQNMGGWDHYGDGICALFQRLAYARGHDVAALSGEG